MKFLDYPELEGLSRSLTFESNECKVFTRLEAYSCKAVKRERQLFKTLESQYLQSASLSPPNHLDDTLASPFGRLDQPSARKTLFLLIATLNGAFPDHDFSDVNPADFRREYSSDSVLNSLGTTLLSLRSNSSAPRSFSSFPSSYGDESKPENSHSGQTSAHIHHPQMAAILDDIMCISECEVYTFHPDADSDPHASAEPDEEGDLMDDDRYADDEDELSDVDGDDGNLNGSTPRRLSFDDTDDAPMFDEDLLGSGFTPVHSRVSSTVTTPRTPATTGRSRDFFSARKLKQPSSVPNDFAKHALSAPSATGLHFPLSHSHGSSDDAMDDSIDDDGSGLHGLLWATYAFFYNRKLKRILFVSVWSRRNMAGMPISYSFSPPSYPAALPRHSMLPADANVPPMSLDGAVSAAAHPPPKPTPQTEISPAKRAIQRTAGRSKSRDGGTRRGRPSSSSPAPSALSPFPHDSPLSHKQVDSAHRSGTADRVPIQRMSRTYDEAPGEIPIGSPSTGTLSTSMKRAGAENDGESPERVAQKQRRVHASLHV